jgi:hypothetical protein
LNNPFDRLIGDLKRELRGLDREVAPPPSLCRLLLLVVRGEFDRERNAEVARIKELAERALKITAKANSALDTVVRAQRELYYLKQFSEVLTAASVLFAKVQACLAAWDIGRLVRGYDDDLMK